MDAGAIIELDAVGLAAAMRSRAVSPVEVINASLARIDEANDALNACCLVLEDDARAAAREAERREPVGPLHGVPVVVKDAIWMRGVPATMGSRALADFVPLEDAVVVRRLRKAGAIVVAKSANPEFLWSLDAGSLHGVTRNPWNLDRSASGSSGGSAAAVASRMVPLALGTDAGGSIRAPAAVCGIVGHKPTRDLVPRTPGFDEMRTTNAFGPLSRSVRDAALALSVLAAAEFSATPAADLRVAWVPDLLQAAHPSVSAVFASTIERIAGWELDEVHPDLPNFTALAYPLWIGELGGLGGGCEDVLTAVGRDLVEESRQLAARDYDAAQHERMRFTADWDRRFAAYDAILLPAFAKAAEWLEAADASAADTADTVGALAIANLTGRPAISVPIGLTGDGLPIGLEVMAARGHDATCFAVAAAIEQVTAPLGRPPHPA